MLEHIVGTNKSGRPGPKDENMASICLHRHRRCISDPRYQSLAWVDCMEWTIPSGRAAQKSFFPRAFQVARQYTAERQNQGRAGNVSLVGPLHSAVFLFDCVKAAGRRGHISTYLCITHTSQVQLHAAAMISYNEIPSIGGAILLVLCNTRQGLFHHSNNL